MSLADRNLPLTPAARLEPKQCVLMVVDMQNDFCAPGGYIDKTMGKDVGAAGDDFRDPGAGGRAGAAGGGDGERPAQPPPREADEGNDEGAGQRDEQREDRQVRAHQGGGAAPASGCAIRSARTSSSRVPYSACSRIRMASATPVVATITTIAVSMRA